MNCFLGVFWFSKFLIFSDVTINEFAHSAAKAIAYEDNISFDPCRPDGSARKGISSERLHNLGWNTQVRLEQGLAQAYMHFQKAVIL